MVVWNVARLLLALALLGIGVFSVVRVPHGVLWKPAVAATEWGHVLAIGCVVPLLGSWTDPIGLAAVAIALLAGALLLSPSVRAASVASTLPSLFAAAFGHPPATPDARRTPFAATRLFRDPTVGPPPLTVAYPAADGTLLPIDLYLPTGASGSAPVLVTVHGGSWNSGDRTVLPQLNRYLAARGVAVAAINYRLAPAHRFPSCRDDVLAAVAWLKTQAAAFGLDPDRIVLHGRSAGGHIALSAAFHTADPAIRGVIAMYPPTDLHWSFANPGNPLVIDTPTLLRDLLGGDPTQVPAAYDAGSPIRFVDTAPPTLLVHGGRDEMVFAEQSRRLARALETAGVRHLVVELPWATHGLDANPSGPGGQITLWLVERTLASMFASTGDPVRSAPA